jgi:hypothetical protein
MSHRAGRWNGVLAACLAVGLTVGCSGDNPAGPDDRAPEPALKPTGKEAREVSYLCTSGRSQIILVNIPDARRLAEVLNPLDLCEFDGDLQEVSLLIGCDSGAPPVPVHVVAVRGTLPASTGRTICGA